MTAPERTNRYMKRWNALYAERSTWLEHWREVAHYLDPNALDGLSGQKSDGRDQRQKIINATGDLSLRNLRSGIMGGLTNPGQLWFKLGVINRAAGGRQAVKKYLEDCGDIILAVFAASNIYNVLHGAYKHLGAYGVAAILIEEDDEDLIRGTLLPIGQYCLAADGRGVIDTCYRRFTLTVRQLVDLFGEDKVSSAVSQMYRQGAFDKSIEVLHVIEPRSIRNPKDRSSTGMPWRSVYLEWGAEEGKYLRESGYREFPVLCPRWDSTGESVYSRGPASLALGDIKQLQQLELRKLEAIAKHVNPPMLLVGDIQDSRLSLQPGAISRVPVSSGDSGFKPVYQIQPETQTVSMEIEKCEARIKRTFFEDLFLIVSQLDNVRTATDIIERKGEKLLMLGPVVQSLERELLNPLIKRAFAILNRAEVLPVPPADLQGESGAVPAGALRPQYESALVSGQKAQTTGHIEAFFQLVGPIIGANPESGMRVDWDEVIKEVAFRTGVSASAIRDDDTVAGMKEQAAQQAAAQQQMEQLTAGAQGAKLLSETTVDPSNALGAMLAGAGYQGG